MMDWELLQEEQEDIFREAISHVNPFTRPYLQGLGKEMLQWGIFGLTASIPAYDSTCQIMIDTRALAEYLQVEMSNSALPWHPRVTVVNKLEIHPRDPLRFNVSKLSNVELDTCLTIDPFRLLDSHGACTA